MIGVRCAGELGAVVVVRRPSEKGHPRLKGIRVATISDLVCNPDDTASASSALSAAQSWARNAGADALLCSATHKALTDTLSHVGYIRIPSNLYVLVRTERDGPELLENPADWWILRGDSRGDEVF